MIEVQAHNLLADPDVAGVVTTVRDVTVRREMEAQLRHQALHDPLTGLANRTLFEDRLAQALQGRRRSLRPVAVIYLDVDGFKSVNDSLGHAAGDELLRTLAARIDECLRGVDTAARLGGDEFACLLADIDELEATSSVVSTEALLRWRHPEHGFVGPDRFIPIAEHPQNAILVRSTIELGQALGLQMVAEGIERDTQLLRLRQAPPSYGREAPDALGQGYFFGRPQDAEAIAGLLAQKPAAAEIAA